MAHLDSLSKKSYPSERLNHLVDKLLSGRLSLRDSQYLFGLLERLLQERKKSDHLCSLIETLNKKLFESGNVSGELGECKVKLLNTVLNDLPIFKL
jgi:hypothetical protein